MQEQEQNCSYYHKIAVNDINICLPAAASSSPVSGVPKSLSI